MSETPIRLAINGARGRMGARLCALAEQAPGLQLVAAIDADDAATRVPMDVVIDFSSPEGTLAACDLAERAGAGLLVGTTGLGPAQQERLAELSRRVAVLVAPNTSLGVAVLRHLVREATRLLPGFDIDIVEAHHNRKKDAPSGTAIALVEAVADAGRELPPERVHSLRGGDIVGEHEVQFAGPGETIRISHGAVSRDLFALGALRAAAWLHGRAAGRYTIDDALGL